MYIRTIYSVVISSRKERFDVGSRLPKKLGEHFSTSDECPPNFTPRGGGEQK